MALADVLYSTRRRRHLSVVQHQRSDVLRQSAFLTWPTLDCSGSSSWRRSAALVSSYSPSLSRCSCAESAATSTNIVIIIGVIIITFTSSISSDVRRHGIVVLLATVNIGRHRRGLSCRWPTSNCWMTCLDQHAAMLLKSRRLPYTDYQ